MRAYASRTGTKRNLDAMRAAGWRLMVSATGVWRTEGFPYAIDNGAWTAYQKGGKFNGGLFLGVVDQLGEGADFVVIPDIVGAGTRSLDFSQSWLWLLERLPRLLLPVQDGMTVADVRATNLLGQKIGIFLGGTTKWKLDTMGEWGALAASVGCYYHVGRVNTKKRIRMCADAGAHSFDGTSVTRFASTLPRLESERRQGHLWTR